MCAPSVAIDTIMPVETIIFERISNCAIFIFLCVVFCITLLYSYRHKCQWVLIYFSGKTFFYFLAFLLLTEGSAGGPRLAGLSTPILAKSTLVERGRILSAFLAALGANITLILIGVKSGLLLTPHPEFQRAIRLWLLIIIVHLATP